MQVLRGSVQPGKSSGTTLSLDSSGFPNFLSQTRPLVGWSFLLSPALLGSALCQLTFSCLDVKQTRDSVSKA